MSLVSFDPFAPDPTPGAGGPDGGAGSAADSPNPNGSSFAAMLAAIRQGAVVSPGLPSPTAPSAAASASSGGRAPAPSPLGSARRAADAGPGAAFLAMIQERASRVNLTGWLGVTTLAGSGAPAPTSDATTTDTPGAAFPVGSVAATGPLGALDPAAKSGRVVPDAAALPLSAYPRPAGDNGRGIHWVPTLYSTPAVVDRFVDQAVKMGVKWVTFLNDGTNAKDNDHLVKKLVASGIEPIVRVYTAPGAVISGDLRGMVQHYSALGVHYYQLYNEPNLNVENAGQAPNVDRYLDQWIPAAREVAAAGGLPGFGALSPGGNIDDVAFFRQALRGIKQRGQADVLDHAWISAHNYTLNHPLDYAKDSNGFLKFRWYNQIAQDELGRSLPIISTEGGTFAGDDQDKTMPAIDEQTQAQMVADQFRYMEQPHEPYYFAATYWVIANAEGGGHDPSFEHQALFQSGSVSPVVSALESLA